MPSPLNAIKRSPVTALTTAQALVGAVLTFLVTHGVLGDVDVSTTTQTIAPFVALALPAVFGALKWRLVTPYAKVRDLLERDGVVSDADFARIGALMDDKFHAWVSSKAPDDGSERDMSALDAADGDQGWIADVEETAEAFGSQPWGAHRVATR